MADPVPAGSDVSVGTYQCTNCMYELLVPSTKHLPPCPACGNGQWNTLSVGDTGHDDPNAYQTQPERGIQIPLPDGYEVTNWFSASSGTPVLVVDARPRAESETRQESAAAPSEAEIVIYIESNNRELLEYVEGKALQIADTLGFSDFSLTEEIAGSIFRRLSGKLKEGVTSDVAKEHLAEIDQALRLHGVGKVQAEVDATNASSIIAMINSLESVPSAVIRVGGLMVIKYGEPSQSDSPTILAKTLTTPEIRALEKNPGIQRSPARALELLASAVYQASLEKDADPDPEQPAIEA